MFSLSNGAWNLIHVKSEFVCSFDGKPGQSVLKLTFHDKKTPPYDQVSLCKQNVRKIDFEFAFRFKDGLIYEIRNSVITKTRREIEYLEKNYTNAIQIFNTTSYLSIFVLALIAICKYAPNSNEIVEESILEDGLNLKKKYPVNIKKKAFLTGVLLAISSIALTFNANNFIYFQF